MLEKHPAMLIPDLGDENWKSFESYDECLDSVPVDVSQSIVEEVASKLHGGAGPGSVDALAFKRWLTLYGRASQVLREGLRSGRNGWRTHRCRGRRSAA